MQMRINRNHTVDQPGDKPPDRLLADGLAGMEGNILPHIAEIRGHQHQPRHAFAPERLRREDKGNQLVVGLVERKVENHRSCGRANRDAHLAIGKAVQRDLIHGNAELHGKAYGIRKARAETLQDDAHATLPFGGACWPSIT